MISKDEVAIGCGYENWEHFEEEYVKAYGEPLQPKLPKKVEDFLRELFESIGYIGLSYPSEESISISVLDQSIAFNKKKLQKRYDEMIK